MSSDNPGVIIRPPFLYLGTLLIAAVLDWFVPASFGGILPAIAWVQIAGVAVTLAGGGIMALAVRRFSHAGTNVPTNLPVTALVTDGLYGLSRNPIYVGMSALYIGLSLLFDNPWALAFLIPILLVMRIGVIAREERYLEHKFGEAYTTYKAKVRRWL